MRAYFCPHIPKTGGTSMLEHFHKHMPERLVIVNDSSRSPERAPSVNLGLYDYVTRRFIDRASDVGDLVVFGHNVYEYMECQVPQYEEIRRFVVVRDPAELAESYYNFDIRLNYFNGPFDDWYVNQRHGGNPQSKWIGYYFGSHTTTWKKLVRFVRQFWAAVPLPRLDVFAHHLCDSLGIPDMEKRYNIRQTDAYELSESQRDLVLSDNKLDTRLYREVWKKDVDFSALPW